MSDLGEDVGGQKCIDYWKSEKVGTELVVKHKNIPTNHFYVLWYQPERTILIHHNVYPRKLDKEKLKSINPKFVYFTSIPADALNFQNEIANWLKDNRHIKLVFQPGTYQIKLGYDAQKFLFQRSYVFVVNKEEAQAILNTTENSPQILLEKMQKLGPEIVCITDGPAGAYMRAGGKNYYMPIYPDPKPAFERTGCGDAFASTFTAMLSLGKTALEALRYAPINSMNVVQHVGAQEGLLTMSEMETWLRNAPSDYKVVEI
jgi:sugar/nucleoside kinase (ribokinase family)